MIIEGVNFIPSPIKKMNRAEFIRKHMKYVWLDRNENDRKKMLGEAYDIVTAKKKES